MIKGNKGEWSEIYTFFKLLSDTKLYSGDASLNKINELFFPIIKILREENEGTFEYHVDDGIILVFGGDNEIRIPILAFKEIAENLFTRIRNEKGVFSLPDVEQFMNSIHCHTLKARSRDKTDIKVVIHDLRTGFPHLLGFSIKSKLGSPSTLLNASGNITNFLYKVEGIDRNTALKVNMITTFHKKFEKLGYHRVKLKFIAPINDIFMSNLMYVDYCMPEILSNITLTYYSTLYSKVADIVNIISEENPLNFNTSFEHDFYIHKIKRFLTDIALGLQPGTPWKGKYQATGGYLIVKEDGDVICYHIYDKNQFEDYLFYNTKLDTPSTTRHLFGDIFEERGQFYLKLNLQIRFL